MITMIRKLPAVDERVETGAVQFGKDWPGVFIRGTDALDWREQIDAMTDDLTPEQWRWRNLLNTLSDTLGYCSID